MKKYLIIGLAVIVIIGGIFLPKVLKKSEGSVSFKTVEAADIPDKIKEILPRYLTEERALTCKLKDDIYVIVTRGEKSTKGYFVKIDKMIKEKASKDHYDLVVYAKFTDPKPNEAVSQEYDYPFVIVKTNLKTMPDKVHLDIEYIE